MICSAFTVDSCFLFSSHCTQDQSTTVPIKVVPCVSLTKENCVQSGWTSQQRNDKNDCITMFCHQHSLYSTSTSMEHRNLKLTRLLLHGPLALFIMTTPVHWPSIMFQMCSLLQQFTLEMNGVWCISNNCSQRCFLILLWGAITHVVEQNTLRYNSTITHTKCSNNMWNYTYNTVFFGLFLIMKCNAIQCKKQSSLHRCYFACDYYPAFSVWDYCKYI